MSLIVKFVFFQVNLYNTISLRPYRPVHLGGSNSVIGQNFHQAPMISIPEDLQSEDFINTSKH